MHSPEQEDGSGQQLMTPPLDGTILPGVTRDSILQLARHWCDCEVLEAPITIGDLKEVRRHCSGSCAGCCRPAPWPSCALYSALHPVVHAQQSLSISSKFLALLHMCSTDTFQAK